MQILRAKLGSLVHQTIDLEQTKLDTQNMKTVKIANSKSKTGP